MQIGVSSRSTLRQRSDASQGPDGLPPPPPWTGDIFGNAYAPPDGTAEQTGSPARRVARHCPSRCRGRSSALRVIRFALRQRVWAQPNMSICHTDGLPVHGAVSEAGRPGAEFRTGGRTNPWPVDRTLDSRSASKNSRVRASGATKRNASSSARRSECLMAADLPSKPSTPRTWACLR